MLSPTYVISSNIDAICWQLGKLYIRFKSGITYAYDNVPYDYFDSLQKVESAGQFFHRYIRSKPQFQHHRLEHDPFTGESHDEKHQTVQQPAA